MACSRGQDVLVVLGGRAAVHVRPSGKEPASREIGQLSRRPDINHDCIVSIEGIDRKHNATCQVCCNKINVSARNKAQAKRLIGNLYVHTKDDRRYLFIPEGASLTPVVFQGYRWKLVVSGFQMSEKDISVILGSLGYLEFALPNRRFI